MVRKKRNKKVIELVEGEGKRKTGVIMGVDVHRDVLAYCIGNELEILAEGTFANTRDQIIKLIRLCKYYQVKGVAMESTAQYHFKLLYTLLDANIPVLVANPRQTKDTQGKKTDKESGRRVFVAHRDGRLKPSVIPSKETMHLRKAMRKLLKLINEQTKIKQRMHQLFHQKDVRLLKKPSEMMKTKWGLNVFQYFLDDEIRLVVEKYYPKKENKAEMELLILGLQSFKSQLDEIEYITLKTDIMQLIMFENLADQLRLVYVKLAEKNQEFRDTMKLLLTIPGIGPDLAAIIIAEIVDISYFKRPEGLSKWAGLAPKVYQSGHRKRVTGKIHKGGNKYLRRALVLACVNVYAKGNKNNPLWNFMKSKYQKPKSDSYWRAICAAARKLSVIIWHVLEKNQEWKCNVQDNSVLKKLQLKIQNKIRGFQKLIEKYNKTNKMLIQELNKAIDYSLYCGNNPKILLKVLLNSV